MQNTEWIKPGAKVLVHVQPTAGRREQVMLLRIKSVTEKTFVVNDIRFKIDNPKRRMNIGAYVSERIEVLPLTDPRAEFLLALRNYNRASDKLYNAQVQIRNEGCNRDLVAELRDAATNWLDAETELRLAKERLNATQS